MDTCTHVLSQLLGVPEWGIGPLHGHCLHCVLTITLTWKEFYRDIQRDYQGVPPRNSKQGLWKCGCWSIRTAVWSWLSVCPN